jgi:glycosyltransferase involved in cell wall biosynthesis
MELPIMDVGVSVSIIVCTHNRAHYLHQCLSSLAAQNCRHPFEVVVIDNGSTDATPLVLREWCEKDSRFRSAREDRLGLSRAKNTGIGMARGGLLVFTDDDVVVAPNWIETYCDFFARHAEAMVLAGGPIVPVPDDLGNWPDWFGERALPDVGLLNYHSERPLGQWEYLWGANMAIPRLMFAQFGPWDETVGRRGNERGTFEDVEYQERIKASGGRAWFCPGAVVYHRVDRRTITPRQVVTTAFTRGRNEFWQESLRKWGEADAVPKCQLSTCLTALAGNLSLWLFWTIAFRLASHQSLFEQLHRTGWTCGWWLGSLDAGRGSMRSYWVMVRGVFLVRRLALWLAPDASRHLIPAG